MRRLVIVALMSSGCSLIVDTDAVRARRDGGITVIGDHPDGGGDALPRPDPDAAPGPDAFADASVAPDAMVLAPDAAPISSCPARAGAAPLACSTTHLVTGGVDLSSPSIEGLPDGFMMAISEQGAVVRRRIALDGTITETERYSTRARPESVAVTTQPSRFAWSRASLLGSVLVRLPTPCRGGPAGHSLEDV